jgi:DNA-binding beta-propeller fold protein YncE
MTIDANDLLYIVDMTGRIQVFDTLGNFQRLWRTPSIVAGKPTGMGINNAGQIMVADTHFYRVLFYSKSGELDEAKTIGGVNGQGPGEFGFVTDAVQDSKGNYFVSEYGEFDRIQKFDSDGNFICQFGRHGSQPLEFNRPQNIVLDSDDNLWIADACNHRIQIIRCESDTPELIGMWGEQGGEVGQLKYPYDLLLTPDGDLIVCEFGNHRVQKMTRTGASIAHWGTAGREIGQTYQPWAIVMDSQQNLHILDTNNHRIQTIRI